MSDTSAALAAAVHLQREVLAATPPDHPHLHGRLYNLSVALRAQYERTGNKADLDEAIEVRPGRARRHPGRAPESRLVPDQPRSHPAGPVRAHRQ